MQVPDAFPPHALAVVHPDHLSTRLGDEIVILGLRDSVYYGLSGTGAHIWELLQTRRSVQDLVALIVAEYEVTAEQAEADLQVLLADLHSRGLVEITTDDPR